MCLAICKLYVANCVAPAFQCWLLERCWLLVARVLVAVLRQGRRPLRPELPACDSTVCVCVCCVLCGFVVVCGCLHLPVVVPAVGVCFCCCRGCGLWLLLCLWVVCLDIVDVCVCGCVQLFAGVSSLSLLLVFVIAAVGVVLGVVVAVFVGGVPCTAI